MTKLKPLAELSTKKARRSFERSNHSFLLLSVDFLQNADVHPSDTQVVCHAHSRNDDVLSGGVAHTAAQEQLHQLASDSLGHSVGHGAGDFLDPGALSEVLGPSRGSEPMAVG